MRNPLHRFRALSSSARLAVLLCAGVVALCLALPPAVFALWDGVLLGALQPRAAAGQEETLPDAGRENQTACLLYDAARLQMTDTSQWPDQPLEQADLADALTRCAAVVDRAEALGLLSTADAARLQRPCKATGLPCRPAGPRRYDRLQPDPLRNTPAAARRGPQPGGPGARSNPGNCHTRNRHAGIRRPGGRPVPDHDAGSRRAARGFAWQDLTRTDYFATTAGLLTPAMELLGVENFSDWQPVSWGDRLPYAGEGAYSAAARLYLSVNANGGLTIQAASMTPDQFADLLA